MSVGALFVPRLGGISGAVPRLRGADAPLRSGRTGSRGAELGARVLAAFASLLDGATPPLDETEVQRLVGAARRGNRGAAEQLYAAHVARVYRAVRPLCGSDAEAEDVTQDAFVDALSHLERYEVYPGTRFAAWLAALALNRARRGATRRARTAPLAPADLAPLAGATDPPEERLVSRRALLAALAALPPRDREVVALYFGAELSAEEVARAVGTSAANVRKICERRRRELAVALGEP